MLVRRNGLVLVLVLVLGACGSDKDDGAESDGGSTQVNSAGPGSVTGGQPHPLVSLTEARLDDFLAVLQAAAADPDKDDGEIAVAQGWQISDWVFLQASINQVVSTGGFDEYLESIRTNLTDVNRQIQEYEEADTTAAEEKRAYMVKALVTLRDAQLGWERTLAQADAMRTGGELVESRMADIKAATGK